ncbi:hypothetical protein RHSIM_Rhsim02G0124900 [Rhododendron simsii]|uniref:AB hydrolase-1 domain-containing protein n=1 Tax=Rhododendron simsii TaxID=118357 RepID=A0A834LWP0_RHOSS|nr:hypothetical protein RHSIM_Rhsim02G0124900 [Rhododendron simsii]
MERSHPITRGYRLSDPPPEPGKTSHVDFVDDMVALLDALDIPKVFLVGKDFGSSIAYLLALLYPNRISGVVTLGLPFGVPFRPLSAVAHHKGLPEGFYISRWKEPGRAEADFRCFDAKTVVRNIYILFSKSEIPIAGENEEIMDMVEPSTPLPPWLTDEDMAAYGALYEKSGFQTGLQVPYRSGVNAQTLGLTRFENQSSGNADHGGGVFKFPGMEDYIRSGEVKTDVPNLETIYAPEGSHFVQEQFPDQVNQLLLTFLNSHS